MRECLEASVMVKWFKKDEPCHAEANRIFKRIRDFEGDFVASEWAALEVVRALVKIGAPKEAIEEAYLILDELSDTGAIKLVPVSQTLELAKDLEIGFKLYAADAVHPATAILSGSGILWSEDEHLNKTSIGDYAKKQNLEIKRLR